MPANFGYAYGKAEALYKAAKTREEKIAALEEMITACPKHKGTENLLATLKSKLAKMREQKETKTARKSVTVKKEGEAQICMLGLPNSGKSTLLARLTGAKPRVADFEYTTTRPEVGMLEHNDVMLQLVEIPSTWTPELLSIARNCDALVLLVDERKDRRMQEKELQDLAEKLKAKNSIVVKNNDDPEEIKRRIWMALDRIHVYTKTPGKPRDVPAITFSKGVTVRDVAQRVHKEFVSRFRFARIYGPSARFAGQTVGMDHVLKDGDVVEIHA
ncbi:MAG: TGS domain-containing protein [Candidatus Aenigmatarchaeota archaeon]|nr:MAG: TGS domain-containing protein [Candidatus Aenigmarchaeota archaeon]